MSGLDLISDAVYTQVKLVPSKLSNQCLSIKNEPLLTYCKSWYWNGKDFYINTNTNDNNKFTGNVIITQNGFAMPPKTNIDGTSCSFPNWFINPRFLGYEFKWSWSSTVDAEKSGDLGFGGTAITKPVKKSSMSGSSLLKIRSVRSAAKTPELKRLPTKQASKIKQQPKKKLLGSARAAKPTPVAKPTPAAKPTPVAKPTLVKVAVPVNKRQATALSRNHKKVVENPIVQHFNTEGNAQPDVMSARVKENDMLAEYYKDSGNVDQMYDTANVAGNVETTLFF